jgi:hypothetical protein
MSPCEIEVRAIHASWIMKKDSKHPGYDLRGVASFVML